MIRRKFKKLLYDLIIIFTVIQTATNDDPNLLGCYLDNTTLFQYVPDNYDLKTMKNPMACVIACSNSEFKFAGLEDGNYCLCAIELPSFGSDNCDLTCSDNVTIGCGGSNGEVSAYDVVQSDDIEGLNLQANKNEVLMYEDVTFTITITKGNNVQYSMDYDDGIIATVHNASDMYTHNYKIPGTYYVTVYASNIYKPDSVFSNSVVINVVQNVSNILVQCPTFKEPGETCLCNISMLQGSSVTMTVDTGDASGVNTYTVAETIYGSLGHNVPQTQVPNIQETKFDEIVIMSNSMMDRDGFIVGLGAYFTFVGTVEFLVLMPSCPGGEYCYSTKNCETSCPTPPDQVECNDVYLPSLGSCESSSGSSSNQYSSYIQLNSYTVDATQTGYKYVNLLNSNIAVQAGNVIGLRFNSQATIGYRNITLSEEIPDLSAATLDGPWRSTDSIYYARAIVSKPATVSISKSYDEIGNYTVNVMCTDEKGSSDNSSAVIEIATGIKAINITLEQLFWDVGRTINVTVMVINGSGFDVIWDFGDGTPSKSITEPRMVTSSTFWMEHSYSTDGVYIITAKAENKQESKNDTKEIYIQQPVTPSFTFSSNAPVISPPGVVNFTVEFPLSDPLPTNVTGIFVWDDGLTLDDMLIPSDTYSVPVLHNYSTSGTYNVTALLKNQVSNATKVITVVVHDRIEGLGAIVKFKNKDSGTSFEPAVGNKQNMVATDSNCSIEVTKTRGTVKGYSFHKDNGTLIQNSSSNILYYAVADKGNYNLIIHAWNDVQDEILVINLEAANMDSGLVIDDFFETTDKNETKLFLIKINSVTSDTCMVVDYGDSRKYTNPRLLPEAYGDPNTCYNKFTEDEINLISSNNLTSPQNVTHLYKQLGNYTINVTTFNAISVAYSDLAFSVTNFPCPKPLMELEDIQLSVTHPTEFQRSEGFYIQTRTVINCTTQVNTTKEWKIYKVDPESGMEVELVKTTKLDSKDKSILFVPELFLSYGHYKAIYKLSILTEGMNKRYPWVRSMYTYFRIVPSPLLAIVVDGSMSEVLRGVGQLVDMNARELSVDPDFPDDKRFNITWMCRRVSPDNENNSTTTFITVPKLNDSKPSTDNGGCFGTGPGILQINDNDHWVLNTSILYAPNIDYEIQITVSKNVNRTATTNLIIKLVDGIPPSAVIRCQNTEICVPINKGLMISPSIRLGVIGQCEVDCEEPIEYSWSVYKPDGKNVLLADAPSYMSETDSDEMALESDFFGNNTDLTEIYLQLSITTANGRGYSGLYLYINNPPMGGSCNVEPSSGKALLDNFRITCDGWTDPEKHAITLYNFYIQTNFSDGQTVIAKGSEPFVDTVLPYGSVTIFVKIGDFYQATVKREVTTINPTLPTKEEFDNFVYSSFISNLIGGGNQEKICQIITAIASIKNAGAFGYNSYNASIENQTESAEVSNIISDMLKGVGTLTTGMLADMEMVSSAMSAIMGMGNEVDSQGKKSSSAVLENLGDVLEKNITPKSPQELQTFARSSLGVIGALSNSISNTLIKNFILPSDYNYLDEIDYDTGSPDNADFEMPKTTEEIQKQAIIESTASNGNTQIKKSEKVFQQIGAKIRNELLCGENPIKLETTNGVSAMFGNFRGENISQQSFKLDDAKFTFPDICVLLAGQNCGLNDSYGLQTLEVPVILESYGKKVKLLSPTTKTIKIELFDADNRPIKVRNLTEPVDIFIPRKDEENEKLPPPTNVTPSIKWYDQMMYHRFNVNNTGSSITIEIKPEDDSVPLLVFVRFGKKPTTSKYDKLARIIDIPKINGSRNLPGIVLLNLLNVHDMSETRDLFLSSREVNSRTGACYLGIAQLNTTNANSDYNAVGNYSEDMMSTNITTTYSLRIYTSGCYYFDEKWETWKSDGCWVHQVNYSITHCKCNHLTTFGSGFFIAPTTVDFDYVFAHASFNDNLTIYLTISITFAIFIIVLIWARYKDRQDKQKLGAAPLPDNRMQDKYLYEILVYTGHKRNAATDSKVYFILSGEDDETEVRQFGDKRRKIFRKGEVDVFVMAVPRPLGALNYLRAWHDNSGTGIYGSWYLNFIVVHDVQNGDKFEFIGNCWFAVEEGDGSVDRLLPVAGHKQSKEFGHLFSNTSQRGIANGHLWFSVFLRPARCRFSRVQRLGCCVAFLYLSMLVNAMWYGTFNTFSQGSAFQIGPFSISTQQIGVGFISNLIVFIPNFVIVFFFRKARPRNLRPSRIQSALERQLSRKGKANVEDDGKEQKDGPEVGLIMSEVKVEKEGGNKKIQATYQKKGKKFTLPWFFQILAWLLVLACILSSVFFLWSYGVTFGNDKTKKWLMSLIFSFFTSLLITEPLKLFLIAMLFSAICKKIDDDDDDADEDEEDATLLADEEYLHKDQLTEKQTRYLAPQPDVLNKARSTRLKEIQMWQILREILGYLLFLWVLVVVSYGNRDPNSYYFKQTLTKAFIREKKNYDFTDMKTTEAFWDWTRNVLVQGLQAKKLYNNKPPFGYKGFLKDQVNRLMGNAIMRQIRINRDECTPPEIMKNVSRPCSGTYTFIMDEDTSNYNVGWQQVIPDWEEDEQPLNKVVQAYRYRSAHSLDGIPFLGRLDIYSGGGYVFGFTGTTTSLVQQLLDLQRHDWIDRFTRAILIEFSVYNTQVNLFGVCSIQLEFVPGGGFFQDYRFDGIRLLQYHEGFGFIVLVCEIAFVLFTIFFVVKELMQLCKTKKQYFSNYWNLAEMCMALLSIAAIIVYIYRMVVTRDLLMKFNETKGSKYINLQFVYMLDQTFGYFISFVVFIATIKFIKLLRFNKRIGILSRTLSVAWAELGVFGLCFLVVFMAFVQLFYLTMSPTSVHFSGFLKTIEYTFSMMLNKFDFAEISRGCPILGPLAFFVFALMTSIVLINLFLTIVIKAFENVAHDVFKQPNDYEIVEFILNRFRNFVGMGNSARPLPSTVIGPPPGGYIRQDNDNSKVKSLPEKVDRLLKYIDDVHFDGKLYLTHQEQLKSLLTKKKKTIYTDTN